MPALPLACLINVEEECNRDQADKYLNGECHLFAIAIARLTNWKIGAITEPRAVFRDSGILSLKGLNHAFCYSPDFPDWCFDALGWRRYQDDGTSNTVDTIKKDWYKKLYASKYLC